MNVNTSLLSSRLGVALLLSALTVGCGQGSDGDPATSTGSEVATSAALATAAVPPGAVRLPHGRVVDARCDIEVPNGGRVDNRGNVVVNGVSVAHHDPCTPEQMNISAVAQSNSGELPSIGHAWVDFTWATAQLISGLSQFNFLGANFSVPAAPTEYTNQVIYLFPSLEDKNGSQEIIQPVLMYGNNGAFGGNYWTIAAYYVGPFNVYHSTPVQVSPGHQLYGSQGVDGQQGFWFCSITDQTTGINTQMAINVASPFGSVQGGVLEVYNIADCNQYPGGTGGFEQFWNIKVSQAGPFFYSQNWVTPNWGAYVTGGLSPNCNYQSSYDSTDAYLWF